MFDDLTEALKSARQRLKGIKDPKLARVPIKPAGLWSSAYYRAGAIYIPRWWSLRSHNAKVYWLLHEYGHAYYDKYCGALRRRRIHHLFGDDEATPYPCNHTLALGHWRAATDEYISGYAGVHPAEDFAETFAHVVGNYECVIPKRSLLAQKVDFVRRTVGV